MGWQAAPNPKARKPAKPKAILETCPSGEEPPEAKRPYTDYDRERWGDTGRDRHVTRIRQRWPSVLDHALRGS